jgi:Ner family transcriptional regulator
MSNSPEAHRKDWTRDQIKQAVYKTGVSLRELSRLSGAASNVCGNALYLSNQAGERLIGEAIGVPPQEIWPSRYQRLRAPQSPHARRSTTLDTSAQRIKNGAL